MNWMAPLRFLYPTANVFGAVKNVVRISYRVESNKPRNAWRKHWTRNISWSHRITLVEWEGRGKRIMSERETSAREKQTTAKRRERKNIRNSEGIRHNMAQQYNSNNNGTEPSNSNHILFWPMFARKTHLSFDKRKRQPGSKQINNWNDEDKSNGQSHNAGKKRRKKERKYCFEKNKNVRCKEPKKEESESESTQ